MAWLRDCSPSVLPTEGDFLVGLGGQPRIGDAAIGIGDIKAYSTEQLMLAFAFDSHLATKDGMHPISRVDIAMLGVLIAVSLIFIIPW